jgi:hypothetical protein
VRWGPGGSVASEASGTPNSTARDPPKDKRAGLHVRRALGTWGVCSERSERDPPRKWWRRGESNPRPKNPGRRCLRVQPTVESRRLGWAWAPHRFGQPLMSRPEPPGQRLGPAYFCGVVIRSIGGGQRSRRGWVKQPVPGCCWQLCVSACFSWRRTTTRCQRPNCPPSNPVRPRGYYTTSIGRADPPDQPAGPPAGPTTTTPA